MISPEIKHGQETTPSLQTRPEMPLTREDYQSKIETPSIETSSIKGETFQEKFESIQSLNDEYLSTGMPNEKIPLTRAIRLIHSKYSNIEPKPLSFTDTVKNKLKSWFQKTLPKYGISSIDDINRKSFFPFLKVDPNIIGKFDYHESETTLGEVTLRTITDFYPGEKNFEMQKDISNFLLEIRLEQRQDNDIIRKFLETCKEKNIKEINYISRPRRIREIYTDIIGLNQ